MLNQQLQDIPANSPFKKKLLLFFLICAGSPFNNQ